MTTIFANVFGIGLPNGPLEPGERERLGALGCDWYLALHPQLDDLAALLSDNPTARGIVRYHDRDILSQSPGDVAGKIRAVWLKMQALTEYYGLGDRLIDLIPGNELNNNIEGIVYPPAESARRLYLLLELVRAVCPEARLHLPAYSPPLDGMAYLLADVDAGNVDWVDVVDAHCYGDSPDALAWLDLIQLSVPGVPVAVTEYNFGAGRTVDPQAYADDALTVLREAEADPHVHSVSFFIWRWNNPDSEISTTLDVVGQPVEAMIQNASKTSRPLYVRQGGLSMPTDERIDQLLAQNALITEALIDFRHGRFEGAEGMDGKIVQLLGGLDKLPDGWNPSYPK